MTSPRFAILVPIYNESKHLAVFLDSLGSSGCHVLAVDDGSTDNSAQIAREKGVETLVLDRNHGKGFALRAGFRRLLEGDYDWVVIMDSDGQHLAGEIPRFTNAAAMQERGIVNGNRLEDPGGMPLIRFWTNRFMSWVVSRAVGASIRDSQCGFKALSCDFLRRASLRCDRFEIEDELLFEASRLGFPIGHVPVSTVYGAEASHIHPFRDTWRFLRFVMSRRRKRTLE